MKKEIEIGFLCGKGSVGHYGFWGLEDCDGSCAFSHRIAKIVVVFEDDIIDNWTTEEDLQRMFKNAELGLRKDFLKAGYPSGTPDQVMNTIKNINKDK